MEFLIRNERATNACTEAAGLAEKERGEIAGGSVMLNVMPVEEVTETY